MGGKSSVEKQIIVESKNNRMKNKPLFERPTSLRKGIGAVGAVAVFAALLTGCTSDSGEDGRIGDEFSSPLMEVDEALATGDPQFLCSHLNSLDQIDCTNLVASSGAPEAVNAASVVVENGELFAFTGDGFLLEILRTDSETPDGMQYEWSVQSFETTTLSFPYGGEYLGKLIEPGTTLRLLPGDLDVSKVRSNVDSDGLWTATPLKTDSGLEFVFAPAADLESRVRDLMSDRCAAHLSSLTVESLLPDNPPKPSFLQGGQEPGARGVSFRYQEQEDGSILSRTMNYPKITDMADCEIREVTASFPEVNANILVPEVLISGEVDYQTERTRFGVMKYGFLPRTVRAPFEISVGITFGETGGSNEISFAEPLLRGIWIINEPIPDNEIQGGRNSG